MKIDRLVFDNYRSLSGDVSFGPGLNIIIGPNSAGKTSIIEALFHMLAVNYTDLRIMMGLLYVLHAARGSEKHSIASMVPSTQKETRICGFTDIGKSCIIMKKETRLESTLTVYSPVVEISITGDARNCSIKLILTKEGINLTMKNTCISNTKLNLGLVTPGVIPYNFFDSLLGNIKRENPDLLDKLTIKIGSKSFKVDVASDEWDMLSAYLLEKHDGKQFNVSFYSTGRGLQRSLLLRAQLFFSDIILIDEIESAMHPELLLDNSYVIIDGVVHNNKQVILTTQSLEAARFLVAALLGADKRDARNMYRLYELAKQKCNNEEYNSLGNLASLIILRNDSGIIKSMKYDGCDAVNYILGSEDVRMAYVLV